jgi:nitrogen regulatory protein PII
MYSSPEREKYELACVIVDSGLGSKILSAAKHHGISGGTVFLGRGTIKGRFWRLLDLNDIRKEIVIMGAERATAIEALEKLSQKFKFDKPNHGIAFCIPIKGVFGTRISKFENLEESGCEEQAMYNAIFTIVDKGKAEDVIEAAEKAGSQGGTIINARGAGIHETSKLFAMDIEPEKEMVLILSDSAKTEAIVLSIRESLEIDKPGNGIIFVQDVTRTYGLYDQ